MSEATTANASARTSSLSAQRRVLQKVAYVSLSLPVLWMFGTGIASRLFAVGPKTMLWTALIPVWLALAAVGAYYLHVLATLHRPALRGVIALGGVWVASSVLAAFVSGIEAGVTVALVLTLVLSFVHSQAVSLTEYLGVQSAPARVGLYGLCLAAAASPVGLTAGVGVVILGALFHNMALSAMGMAIIAVSLAPAVAAALLSRKARRKARELVERLGPQDLAASN